MTDETITAPPETAGEMPAPVEEAPEDVPAAPAPEPAAEPAQDAPKSNDADASERGRERERSRSQERRRSRSHDRDVPPQRTRRSRFEEESEAEKEERRKRVAAAAAAAAGVAAAGGLPKPPAEDPAAAALRQQQMLLQQQLLAQQQAALQAQMLSRNTLANSNTQRLMEKQAKAARELFVGNLTPGMVTDASLYQVFHSALVAAFPQAAQPGNEPVMKVSVTGRFAFIELRQPEYATAALQLNGQIALMGNTLKIARPASYNEAQAALAPLGINMPGAPPGMPGAVAAPVPGALPTGLPGALPGLPGALPGLLPGMAAPLPGPPAMIGGYPAAPGIPGIPGMPGALPGPPSGGLPAVPPLPGVPAGLPADPSASVLPTQFLCVTGMITVDVLASDEEYKEVIGDLQQECAKFGAVVDVKVPRPPAAQATQLMGTGNYGKAFVQFVDVPSAQRAKDAISGRMFAGNIVNAFFIGLPTYQAAM